MGKVLKFRKKKRSEKLKVIIEGGAAFLVCMGFLLLIKYGMK